MYYRFSTRRQQRLLENSAKAMGRVPNIHTALASSPPALEAYQSLHRFFQNSSFTSEEKTVIWQTLNVEHGCLYCVPAHTAIARTMKVDPSIISALRCQSALPNEKLETLRLTTLSIVRKRGRLSPADSKAFFDVGFDRHHLLEILIGVAEKVMSNYLNHMFDIPLDEPFQQFKWKQGAAA